ncbi:auxin efflux carrier [Gongronella butleri]|nr:auxin efflux carrier [Gongronella butleri]
MLELVLAALQAIFQVVAVVALGAMLTRAGYFDESKQKWMSRLNMDFFTPCLLFTSIAPLISVQKLLEFWPIPAFQFVFLLVSWAAAEVTSRVFGVTADFRRLVTVCAMFLNTNSLPIAIISSLAYSEAGQVLYWHADDTRATVAARGIAYTLFYAMFCNIVRWSYGYHLLQPTDMDNASVKSLSSDQGPILPIATPKSKQISIHDVDDDDRDVDLERQLRHLSYSSTASTIADDAMTRAPSQQQLQQQPSQQQPQKPSSSPLAVLSSFPKYPSETSPLLSGSGAGAPITPVASSGSQGSFAPPNVSVLRKIGTLARILHGFMSPPLYAALLALGVGLSPLQPLLFDHEAFLYASLTQAVEGCGRASVPLLLLCLGAQLTLIAQQQLENNNNGLASSSPEMRNAVFTSLITRFAVMPPIVFAIVYAWMRCCPSVTLTQDPMFIVTIIVLGCLPSAVSLTQITQVTGVFQEEMMHVLFWSYGVLCVPVLTVVILTALYLVQNTM